MTPPPASHAEWFALVREGTAGNSAAFQLRLTRLIARLRREKSPLAPLLAAALSEVNQDQQSLARDHASQHHLLSPVDGDSNLPLTTLMHPAHLDHAPIWAPAVGHALGALINEWRHADRLLAADLTPSRTVLLSGPPGVGKTLAATYVAQELRLPLITLNLAAAVNSFLGKTGTNLVRVLNHARQQPCVLLLDEFDALAKRRDDGQDVGELKRVVNVLLQAIDEWPATSLLVAATNHEELLDRAVFRRFDLWLQFPESNVVQIRDLLEQLGCPPAIAADIAPSMVGQPLSDVTRLVQRARRQVALHGTTFDDALMDSLSTASPDRAHTERYLQVRRLQAEGHSLREIGKQIGAHASTVSRILQRKG